MDKHGTLLTPNTTETGYLKFSIEDQQITQNNRPTKQADRCAHHWYA